MFINNPVFEIRKPLMQEVASVKTVFSQILNSSFPMFAEEALINYQKTWFPIIEAGHAPQHNKLFEVAWDAHQPIGILIGTAPEGGVATVIWLLVQESFRNKGVGLRLLNFSIDYYRRLHCHKLKLTAPSEKAKHFYEKHGMKVEGYHPNHWWKTDYWSLAIEL